MRHPASGSRLVPSRRLRAGPAGTSVKGFLEVATLNPNTISGDTPAAFPYAYRIQ